MEQWLSERDPVFGETFEVRCDPRTLRMCGKIFTWIGAPCTAFWILLAFLRHPLWPISLPFSVLMLVVGIVLLVKKPDERPLLLLDRNGLTSRAGFIPWDEVESYRLSDEKMREYTGADLALDAIAVSISSRVLPSRSARKIPPKLIVDRKTPGGGAAQPVTIILQDADRTVPHIWKAIEHYRNRPETLAE